MSACGASKAGDERWLVVVCWGRAGGEGGGEGVHVVLTGKDDLPIAGIVKFVKRMVCMNGIVCERALLVAGAIAAARTRGERREFNSLRIANSCCRGGSTCSRWRGEQQLKRLICLCRSGSQNTTEIGLRKIVLGQVPQSNRKSVTNKLI